MNKRSSIQLGAICLMVLLSSCATVEKPVVQPVEAVTPRISSTVKSEQENIDNKRGLKRKVAIARFTNESKYGQSFLIDDNDNRVGKQAVDILSAKMLETEKFILLERADMDKINKELEMENYGSLKNMADYLIVGSVTEFGRKDQGKVGLFSRTRRQSAFAKVYVRLIDVRSGQILYSEEGESEAFSEAGSVLGVGAQAGYDSSINDKALDGAITNLASNIVENLLDRPWQSYVLGVENGQLIIAGGASQNIKKGDIFTVMKEGKKVNNPQTNTMITLPGTPVGKIKAVISVGDTAESEVTLCDVTEGDFSTFISSGDFSQLLVREN